MKNRRAFFEYGQANDEQAKRYNHTYTVIMMDLDRFKKINDSYGHSVGDQVLKLVAKTILITARSADISARIGGEEFAIILPETAAEEALDIAERLRLGIESIFIQVEGKDLVITSSFGVAECLDEEPLISNVLGQADSALYQAKEQGRNRVVLFQPGPDLI
ncbi:MAG: GGDEF domain-containing protein [Gammaproteobacteria bacterium]|nr:GGDEF domain-containing protein [Gammaproteobacteria bacterium]